MGVSAISCSRRIDSSLELSTLTNKYLPPDVTIKAGKRSGRVVLPMPLGGSVLTETTLRALNGSQEYTQRALTAKA